LELDLPDLTESYEKWREWVDGLTEHLPESARNALRFVSIFSEPAERKLLQTVCEVHGSNAAAAIDELIESHLLERDAKNRYSLHDILRDYWREKLADDAKLLHARAAAWLDEQRAQIKQAQSSSDITTWHENVRQSWVNYTRRALSHWRDTGEPAIALACAEDLWQVTKTGQLCQQAVDLCLHTANETARATWLRREAELLSDPSEAYERYSQSIALAVRVGDKHGQAVAESGLSWLYFQSGAYGDAYYNASSSFQLSQEIGDKVTQAEALYVMGLVDELYRKFSDALSSLKNARALRREANLPIDKLQEDILRVRRAISMRTILTTVGTSLLSNAAKCTSPIDITDEHQLARYLRETEAAKASAETNSLSRLLTEGDDRIVFLHSQTDEGRQCAEALQRRYEKDEYDSRFIQVPDLSYSESRFKMRGLRSLVATLIDQIQRQRAEGREVIINATGGFKAEIAYATLVGLLFDVPVYYIHEVFPDIIEMPPTPINWDYSLLADCEDFFDWIDAELRTTAEVGARLRGLPGKVHLLLTEEEDFTMLSPTGEAFYKAYRDRLEQAVGVPISLSTQAWETYRDASSEVKLLFDRTLRKLRLRELWITGADRVRNSDCLIYPKGPRDERAFFFESDNREIRVCELARHSDQSYERLIERGVRRENYDDFRVWREGGS
jgi:putative CRISPR-associated protein (TIGR02619 family)